MPVELTNLSDLNADAVAVNLAEIAQRVQERNTSIDVKRGVFHDLIGSLHAELSTQQQTLIDSYLRSRSLLAIEADPELADDDIVDNVLSNYRLTRQAGSAATGEVTIVVSSPTTVTIANGATFAANGQIFTANSVFTAKSQAAQVTATTDRLLIPLSDGNYAFNVNVTATEDGVGGRVGRNTYVRPTTLPANYVTSYAANDFQGGNNVETNTELLNRLQQGLAAQASSNRVNMFAMLGAIYPATADASIIGYGDPEMLRDQHSVLPLSLGGRVDWYIRTQEQLLTRTLQLSATLVSKNTDGSGLWQLSFGKDTAPGFYEVESVLLPSSEDINGSFNIESDVRGTDLTGTGLIPDIVTTQESEYSRFQTAVVQFTDTETAHAALTVGDSQIYNVAVRMMPDIDVLHDTLADRDRRGFGADVLIKAPVPCFVTVSLTLHNKNTSSTPDTEAIQTALAEEINTIRFNGRVYASQLHEIIHDLIDTGTSVGHIDIFGRIRRPGGGITYIRDDDYIEVPDLSSDMTSYRTVQFFADPDDITVSISTEVPTAD